MRIKFVIGSTKYEFRLVGWVEITYWSWKLPNGEKARAGAEKTFGAAMTRAGCGAKAIGAATGVSVW